MVRRSGLLCCTPEKLGAAYTRIELPGIGHNLPQEAPAAFVDAALRLAGKA